MKSCAQERVISLCNCASAAYPIPNGVRICDQAQNETDGNLVTLYLLTFYPVFEPLTGIQ